MSAKNIKATAEEYFLRLGTKETKYKHYHLAVVFRLSSPLASQSHCFILSCRQGFSSDSQVGQLFCIIIKRSLRALLANYLTFEKAKQKKEKSVAVVGQPQKREHNIMVIITTPTTTGNERRRLADSGRRRVAADKRTGVCSISFAAAAAP